MNDRPGVVFVHAGRAYELLAVRDWPLRALREITRGNLDALAELLSGGDAELERLLADGFTIGQLNDLVEQATAEQQLADDDDDQADDDERTARP